MTCLSKYANNINKINYIMFKLNLLVIGSCMRKTAEIIFNLNKSYYKKYIQNNPSFVGNVRKDNSYNRGMFIFYYILIVELYYYIQEYINDPLNLDTIEVDSDIDIIIKTNTTLREAFTIICDFAYTNFNLINYINASSSDYIISIKRKPLNIILGQFTTIIDIFATMYVLLPDESYMKTLKSYTMNLNDEIIPITMSFEHFIKFMTNVVIYHPELKNIKGTMIIQLVNYLYLLYIKCNNIYNNPNLNITSYNFKELMSEEDRQYNKTRSKSCLKF